MRPLARPGKRPVDVEGEVRERPASGVAVAATGPQARRRAHVERVAARAPLRVASRLVRDCGDDVEAVRAWPEDSVDAVVRLERTLDARSPGPLLVARP